MKIFVVGGGISGLTTAYQLMRTGHDVRCFEPAERPGGVVRSQKIDGFLCETGPQAIVDGAPEVRALISDLKLSGEIIRPSPVAKRRFVYLRGKLHPVPTDPLSLLRSGILSTAGKWRLAREPFISKAREMGQDESIFDFGVRRLGPEAARSLIAPATIGVFAGDAAALSLRSCFPRLAALEAKHGSLLRGVLASRRDGTTPGTMFSFHDGLEQLPRALAAALGDRLIRAAVTGVGRQPGGWFAASASQRHTGAEALVLATPAKASAMLLEGVAPAAANALRAIPLAPVAVVCLGFARASIGIDLDAYGFLVAREQGVGMLGCQYESSVFAGRTQPGQVLLRAMLGGTFHPQAVDASDEELIRQTIGELQTVAGLTARPHLARVWRHHDAIPQYNVGHETLINSIDYAMSSQQELYVTGAALRGTGLNDCLRNAIALAATITGERSP